MANSLTNGKTLVRNNLVEMTRRTASRFGFDMVYRNYYSPIPQVAELPADTWSKPASMYGVPFSLQEQLRYLDDLEPYIAEFRSGLAGSDGKDAYYLDNGSFGPVDADVLYATIRTNKPRRMIELGSGSSTLVSAAACAANAAEGRPTELFAFDPYPPSFVSTDLAGLTEMRAAPATSVPIEDLASLERDDILFIDTTHTVKVGGEVNHLVLEVLPRLQPGVLVHFHDIFLPWEYPREWIERRGYYWAEQYLLHAFLAQNTYWNILFAAHFLYRQSPSELASRIDSEGVAKPPSSLWLRRADA